MSYEYEQVAQAEAEHPAYLDHWTQFADEQIGMEQSPIREDEQVRFRIQCAENAASLAHAREAMLAGPDVRTVNEWYARLGSTADLETAKPDLNLALSALLNSPEGNARDEQTMMLAGNIAQEIGLVSRGRDADGYFAVASKVYATIINKHDRDLNVPVVRQALAHSFDTAFARLSQGKRDGLIDQASFDKEYDVRHKEYVLLCAQLAGKDSTIGNGELYEFYGEMMLRHRLWARERFGDAEVRRAFTPREDKPHDGFRRGGRHVNQAGALPCYSFDLKVTAPDGSADSRQLQMKADTDDFQSRYGKPTITVIKYGETARLRDHVSRMADIMQRSYRFDSTEAQEAELAAADASLSAAGV